MTRPAVTEQTFGNSWQWAVKLSGTDYAAVRARADEIRAETQDAMTAYMSATREGVREIIMEFQPKDADA